MAVIGSWNGTPSHGAGRLPPSPKGTLLLGNALQLKRDPLGFLNACARSHGDVVRLQIVHKTAYLVNGPPCVEYVLSTISRNFVSRWRGWLGRVKTTPTEGTLDTHTLFGERLMPDGGDFWLRERRWAQPALHQRRIAEYATVMTAHAERMLATWSDGEVRDIHQDMLRLALENVALTLFGVDVRDEADELLEAVDIILEQLVSRMSNPFEIPMVVPTSRNRRFNWALDRFDAFVDEAIRHYQTAGDGQETVLALLMRARAERGGAHNEQEWRHGVMTFFMAGFETVALTLTWTAYQLSQNPEIDERLVAELRTVLGGRTPSAADYRQLPFTEMIVKETLRLYPPVWLLAGREAAEDCEVGGYRMPAGTMLFVSPWVAHRDPRYFDDPESYRPDRWAESRQLPKYAYFPFSDGPRHCIGHGFAMMEAVMLLATMAQSFRLELAPNHPVVLQPLVSLRPLHGMRMRIRRRD